MLMLFIVPYTYLFLESESAGTFMLFVFQILFEGIVLKEILGEL